MTLVRLIVTGRWSDRTAVIDIVVVQIAVTIDIEHISIAVRIHVIRRERPSLEVVLYT